MRGDARQFAADCADVLAALWNLVRDTQQFFHGEHVVHVVCQRREVIQPIRVRDELIVGHALGDLLIASMQITHVRLGTGDDLAVQLNLEAQHAVRGRMGGAHVEHHFLAAHIGQLIYSHSGTGRGVLNFDFLRGTHGC